MFLVLELCRFSNISLTDVIIWLTFLGVLLFWIYSMELNNARSKTFGSEILRVFQTNWMNRPYVRDLVMKAVSSNLVWTGALSILFL